MLHRQASIIGAKLSSGFYRRADVVRISQDLLGQYLFTRIGGQSLPAYGGAEGDQGLTGGRIVETEAYAGATDRASHAYGNRRTRRTAIMFEAGGVAYVYLCYGLHALFNIVTSVKGIPHAVLIRALEPTHGIPVMLQRRRKARLDRTLTAGPGALAQALGITVRHSGQSLQGGKIWLEQGMKLPPKQIGSTTRVGVDYAAADAKLPWRFRVRASAWTSLAK